VIVESGRPGSSLQVHAVPFVFVGAIQPVSPGAHTDRDRSPAACRPGSHTSSSRGCDRGPRPGARSASSSMTSATHRDTLAHRHGTRRRRIQLPPPRPDRLPVRSHPISNELANLAGQVESGPVDQHTKVLDRRDDLGRTAHLPGASPHPPRPRPSHRPARTQIGKGSVACQLQPSLSWPFRVTVIVATGSTCGGRVVRNERGPPMLDSVWATLASTPTA
jgi:hypothetical protein